MKPDELKQRAIEIESTIRKYEGTKLDVNFEKGYLAAIKDIGLITSFF